MSTISLFDNDELEKSWEKSWKEMPEFSQQEFKPIQQIIVSFKTHEDVKKFGEILNKKLTYQTKSFWFPENNRESPSDYVWTANKLNTKYPVYIISKGRWESRLTSKSLESMGIDYKICVEPSEYELYASVIDKNKIIKLPEDFSKLNQGGIPVRNFVWNHSIANGHKRHWILDDNIDGFIRLTNNMKIKVDNAATFRAIEDYCDRYENVMMAGMDYRYFANQDAVKYPYTLNTRIYSCILLNNEVDFNKIGGKWRGRYNEDTDLSIRILKAGYCTLLFKTFLCNKITTMQMKGGNTDTIYNTGDNRLKFAESLVEQHPDIAKVVWRYERWHHEVDYSKFQANKLIEKNNLCLKNEVNNYGLTLIKAK
jgi:hypothetical protein